ncbi:transposase [Deinococcus fonticola]|uniref:transposase n=1 Tax=Deinococcus fonticola TaxID=2528713 RepID=UPI001074A0E8|nr:transposase [Deinococcus fonticola]
MDRPDFSVLPIPQALDLLSSLIAPRLPPKLIHAHEKVSDADLIALAVLRFVRKVPYFSQWWTILKVDVGLTLPSESQAHVRLKRLLPFVEAMLDEVEHLDFVLVDSEPIPSCRFKRASRCKFPGATFGFTTQGMIYGYKLHAWTTPAGRVVRYLLRPANQHDVAVGYELNEDWPAVGGPKVIGDKAYQDGANLTPPKANARTVDPRWRDDYEPLSKAVECAFSSVVGRGLRWGQVKTLASLRLKVALILVAYNPRFRNFALVNP